MTDDTPYLIAHLVRGKPAFDIAIQMIVEDPDDPWWILPSTGHRAYPFEHWRLFEVANITIPVELPQDWPDFWRAPTSSVPEARDAASMTMLEKLGLLAPTEPYKRRA